MHESVELADELTQTKPRQGHLNTPELPIGPAVGDRQPRHQHATSNNLPVTPTEPSAPYILNIALLTLGG